MTLRSKAKKPLFAFRVRSRALSEFDKARGEHGVEELAQARGEVRDGLHGGSRWAHGQANERVGRNACERNSYAIGASAPSERCISMHGAPSRCLALQHGAHTALRLGERSVRRAPTLTARAHRGGLQRIQTDLAQNSLISLARGAKQFASS